MPDVDNSMFKTFNLLLTAVLKTKRMIQDENKIMDGLYLQS